jgi:hypothetical protein
MLAPDMIAGLVYYLPQFHNLTLRARSLRFQSSDGPGLGRIYRNHFFTVGAELPIRYGRASAAQLR